MGLHTGEGVLGGDNYVGLDVNRATVRRDVRQAYLSLQFAEAQVRQLIANTPVEIEVFGFGSLCVMVEGRCALSSYATGQSPNNAGVCSPASAVRCSWS